MATATFAIAMWQVFATDISDTSVVSEIMDFAALLIVIELDDFLMCYPGQLYARKHFGDDFLQHNFEDKEVQ
jgi:hypothetical protein